MLKGPITLGKGLAITGSLGGLLSFFGFGGGLKDRERIFEVVSTVKNTDWNTGYVTPVFNSSWLGGGFENQTEYSYGYVARVVGHNFYESQDSTNSKRLKRDLSKKEQEAEAELVLVEKVGNQTVVRTDKKNGLTPKKFLLIGSNKSTGEVEVTGLVSLIQFQHGGIKAKCSKDEGHGAIRDGSCDKIFFPTTNGETPKFIKEELQKTDGSGVSIMKLDSKGKSLGAVFGSKGGNAQEGWSKTGYLYLGERNEEKVTKAKKVWTQLKNFGTAQKQVALFFVVHDLIFSEGALKGEYKKKYDTYGTIYAGNDVESNSFQASDKDIRSGKGKVIDISLSSSRNYYIWDPSKTKIKNGEFVADDGVKLPFKLGVNATWNSSLIK